MSKKKTHKTLIAGNKKARYRYEVLRSLEAGIVLVGTEVKALREGNASISESYAVINNGEVWLINSHVAQYTHASWSNHEPNRKRKLLLNKREIKKLARDLVIKGNTLIPLELYFNERGCAKVQLALAGGKKQHDKREALKEQEAERELRRPSI